VDDVGPVLLVEYEGAVSTTIAVDQLVEPDASAAVGVSQITLAAVIVQDVRLSTTVQVERAVLARLK
jgi:hypothetical protein